MRELWCIATAAAVLSVTACSKGEGTTGPVVIPPPATPTGSYTLSTIDAKVMPYTIFTDPAGYKLEVLSGTLSVTAAGKWVSKIVSRETVSGNVSLYADSTFGTWSLSISPAAGVFLNTETGVNSNVTWTAVDVTVDDVDGAVTHKVLYKKN